MTRVPGFVAVDTFFFHDPVAAPRPPWWRAVSWLALAVVAIAPFLASAALAPPQALRWSDKHRNTALEIAFNRVTCGTQSRLSPSFPIARELELHPELHTRPLRDVALGLAGSLVQYCDSAVQPFMSGENSLMLEMTLFMKATPGLSLRQLGYCLQATRIAALLFCAFVLLECGASLLYAASVLVLGLGILAYLGSTAHYSVYPFAPVQLALGVAFLSFCLGHGLPLRLRGHVAAALVAGWLTAFAVNMRSSHLPIHVAFLALYFAAGARARLRALPSRPLPLELAWIGVGVLSAGLGYGLFSLTLVRPLLADSSGGQAHPYHSVALPLVVGLAVPENALSKREGIVWEDSVGLELARRVDPRVSYYREGFEAALFAYYSRLWRQHPREMLEIYWNKLQIAGRSMISKLSASPIGPIAWPAAWLPNGATFLLVYVALFGMSVAASWRTGAPLAFLSALVTLAGLLLQLEAALVYPVFDMTHHSSQLLFFLMVVLALWQLPLEGLRLVVRRRRGGARLTSGDAARRVAG